MTSTMIRVTTKIFKQYTSNYFNYNFDEFQCIFNLLFSRSFHMIIYKKIRIWLSWNDLKHQDQEYFIEFWVVTHLKKEDAEFSVYSRLLRGNIKIRYINI